MSRWISIASGEGAAAWAGAAAGVACALATVARPEANESAATARVSWCSDVIEERGTRMVAILGVLRKGIGHTNDCARV